MGQVDGLKFTLRAWPHFFPKGWTIQKIPSNWQKRQLHDWIFILCFVGMGSSLNLFRHFTCQTSFPDFRLCFLISQQLYNARISILFRGRRMVSYPKSPGLLEVHDSCGSHCLRRTLEYWKKCKVIQVNENMLSVGGLLIEFESLLPPSQCHSEALVEECCLNWSTWSSICIKSGYKISPSICGTLLLQSTDRSVEFMCKKTIAIAQSSSLLVWEGWLKIQQL